MFSFQHFRFCIKFGVFRTDFDENLSESHETLRNFVLNYANFHRIELLKFWGIGAGLWPTTIVIFKNRAIFTVLKFTVLKYSVKIAVSGDKSSASIWDSLRMQLCSQQGKQLQSRWWLELLPNHRRQIDHHCRPRCLPFSQPLSQKLWTVIGSIKADNSDQRPIRKRSPRSRNWTRFANLKANISPDEFIKFRHKKSRILYDRK